LPQPHLSTSSCFLYHLWAKYYWAGGVSQVFLLVMSITALLAALNLN
jgi:hypothetical protein